MKSDIITSSPAMFNRPSFGQELIQVGTSEHYHISHDEFHSAPVSDSIKQNRDNIYVLQALLSKSATNDELASKCSLTHRLSPGIYCREFCMPAGAVIAGHRHAREHIVFVLAGSATVYEEDKTYTVTAPATFISPAGTKRLLVIHSDSTWTTVHRTDATSIAEAENELLINEQAEHNEAVEKTAGATFESVFSNYIQIK
jgi:quercetin dioxygenase-like cupin family protein